MTLPHNMPPRHLPDLPGDLWTPDLGKLASDDKNKYLMLARVLRDPAGQDNVRGIWRDIDRSVEYSKFDHPANRLAPNRVFAGISQDGGRYIEVYEKQERPGTFGIFIAGTMWADNGLVLVDGVQQSAASPDGDFWISFNDPAPSAPGKPAALHVRRLDDGTSSYFGEAGNTGSYDGEYFPIGYMQDIVRFDTDNLRGTTMDGQGVPHGTLINVSAPPLPPQPAG